MLARLLRRTECMAQVVPQSKALTAAPKHCTNPQSFSAVPIHSSGPVTETVARKRRRKRVRVEGLYREREPEPKLHAQALLELIQDECPEEVGSFIPRCHLDRAYRELRDHEGWKALSLDGHRPCARQADLQEASEAQRCAVHGLPAPSAFTSD